MKNKTGNKQIPDPGNKPFIPKSPDSKETEPQDENDPSPNSDPNYSYYPNMAFPTGPEETEKKDEGLKDAEQP